MLKIKNEFKNCYGQSIVEIVVALGIFAFVAATLAVMILGGQELVTRSSEMLQAQSYLQEGSEAVRSIRYRAWNELIFTKSGLALSDNEYILTGEGTIDTSGIFTRTIDFFPVFRNESSEITDEITPGVYNDVLSKKIVISVSWDIGNGASNVVRDNIHLTDWNAYTWEQADWSGGSGQTIWSNSSRYLSSDGNININELNQISLKEIATSTYAQEGYLQSSAFNTSRTANYSAIRWEQEIPDGCAECLIKFQIKTAPDNDGLPGTWSASWSGPDGEDGDENDSLTVATGEIIPSDQNGKQWVKYKVVLSGDSFQTPVLKNIKIYYQ